MMEVERPIPSIRAVDLFCGVGGLTHGLIRGGIDVAAGIDLDGECRLPYEANNASRFVQADIKDVTAEDIRDLLGDAPITLVAGCAPCQPFSTYSRKGRASRGGEDWELVASFGRLVQEVRPHLVTMENVPSVEHHSVFREFLASLVGYAVAWRTVECSSIGVPQTRKRLVLVASRLGDAAPSLEWSSESKQTVRSVISGLPPLSAGAGDPSDPMHLACRLSETNLRRIRASRPGGSWRDWPEGLRAACHRKVTGDTYPSVYGRMEWDQPAPTITTQSFGYGNGRFGHPEQDRAITLREAAMLQTFPRDYRFVDDGAPVRFATLGRLIGNAVPVRLGERIAQAFREHVSESWIPHPI